MGLPGGASVRSLVRGRDDAKIVGRELVPLADQERVVDDVLELANVAGPRVLQQPLRR